MPGVVGSIAARWPWLPTELCWCPSCRRGDRRSGVGSAWRRPDGWLPARSSPWSRLEDWMRSCRNLAPFVSMNPSEAAKVCEVKKERDCLKMQKKKSS